MATILLIEDNEPMARVLARHMELEGHTVILELDGAAGLEAFHLHKVDLVLTDLKLQEKSGLEVLQAVKEANPMIPVVVMTTHGTIETAVKAVKEGAFDFLEKPVDPDHLLLTIGKALETKHLVTENLILKEDLSQTRYAKLVGQSRLLSEAQEKANRVAAQLTPVLLLGENGTEKDLFALLIHDRSPRKDGPFLHVDCLAIPSNNLETELFGHEKGAFAGAARRRAGKFELADGGTIFLDEIGDIDQIVQAKLLNVLTGNGFMRVGGTSPVKVNTRLVVATEKDLGVAVAKQTFRGDLYYRLSVFPIIIPPLRERRTDIPLLAEHFLRVHSQRLMKEVKRVSPEALELIMRHPWTGNLWELEPCIERAITFCDGPVIYPQHLKLSIPAQVANEVILAREEDLMSGSLQKAASAAVRRVESRMIERVLRDTGGNKSKAAEILKVSYKTLLTKIKDYGLDKG